MPSDPSSPSENNATAASSNGRYIVDDNAAPEPGQMRKAEFINRLKSEVYDTANHVLAGTPVASNAYSYIESSFASSQQSSPAQIEASINQYCPSAAGAANAEDVILQVKGKVSEAAQQWLQSGGDLVGLSQIFDGISSVVGTVRTGVNSAIDTVTSGISSVAGTIASGISSVTDSVGSGIGNAASGIKDMFFKENAGGAIMPQSPRTVMQSLGNGNSIESRSRSKMENAFGENFSGVQIHTDSHAAQLSRAMNARAFTVGNHIAFAADEYKPGTLIGDALMAHELAHTMQQAGTVHQKVEINDTGSENSLENDADASAIEAVATIWSDKTSVDKKQIRPKVKRGLNITRCNKKKPAPDKKPIEKMDLAELNEIINNPSKYSLGEIGAAKARAMMLEHQESIARTGKGTIQGNKCGSAPSPGVGKQDCTTYVIDILKFAFTAKGQGALWDDVFNTASANSDAPKYGTKKGFKGIELINSLVDKAGWKAVFWSPDPKNPSDSLPEHPTAYNKVNSSGTYYDVPVNKEDSVVNYNRTSASAEKDTTKLEKLKRVPLAVIGARGGFHMTVLINGVVYEVHWDKPETDPNVIQATPLENWEWKSGVLVMPESDYQTIFKGE